MGPSPCCGTASTVLFSASSLPLLTGSSHWNPEPETQQNPPMTRLHTFNQMTLIRNKSKNGPPCLVSAAGDCGYCSSLIADSLQLAGPPHDVWDKQESRRTLNGFYWNQETFKRNLLIDGFIWENVGAKLHPLAVGLLQNQHLRRTRPLRFRRLKGVLVTSSGSRLLP